MAALYSDENVPPELSEALRQLGHDVLTVQADGRASQKIPDPDVLARAIALGRAVLTNNRKDFHALHRADPGHLGIITFTQDADRVALAGRIDAAIGTVGGVLASQLIKIIRPNPAASAP